MILMAWAYLASPSASEVIVADLMSLQWWQQLGLVLGALGLSAVPWIGGLAAGKIGFTSQHALDIQRQTLYYEALLKAKDERYADLQKDRDGWKSAAQKHEERGNRSTDVLEQVVPVLQATNAQLAALNEIAREAGA